MMHLFNFDPIVSKLIQSYQQKICYYDKQQWEQRSAEDQILSKTENVAVPPTSSNPAEQGQRSSVSAKNGATIATNASQPTTTDLIDLDLISGSAYTMKSKSNQGWISMLFQAVLRVLFFPLYLRWWSEQTSPQLVGLLLCLYILQIFAIRIYYQKTFAFSSSPNNGTIASSTSSSSAYSNKSDLTMEISPTEVFMPVAMMVVLGIIHTQIVGTKNYIKSSFSSSTSSSSSLSSNPASSMFHSSRNRKNSSQHAKDVSQHTDCSSSSSASSTSSSVDSSPVADVRMRIQNRITRFEKFKPQKGDANINTGPMEKSALHIPKIRFYHEPESPKVFLIDDMDDIDDQHMKRFNETTQFTSNNCFRRRSDSMPKLSSSMWTLKKARKPRAKAQNSKPTPPLKLSSSWNNCDDDNDNYSPISMQSSLYGSSFDSEVTISPITTVNHRSEPQWSRKHSDVCTSDVDDDDDDDDQCEHTAKVKHSKLAKSNSISEKNHHTSADLEKSAKIKAMSLEDIPPVDCELNSMNLVTPSNELKVSCSLWQYNVCQKIDLSVADISSAIIRKVETVEHSTEYIWLGIIFSMTVALIPSIYRMQFSSKEAPNIANILAPHHNSSNSPTSNLSTPSPSSDIDHLADLHELIIFFLDEAFFLNKNSKIRFVVIIVMIERFFLSLLYFFLLCVTERTFKQRFLYSKYFSHITRRDRAKRSQIPHFRLHKVRNLKVWLSVRSYLRRYGPHRSVDTICSTTFIISICLLTCISLQILRDSNESCFSRLICWEMIFWSLALGIYIMRLMILGSRINQKYRSNLSVLIAEQINLYLQLECKPHKKDTLMLANQVLKLAVDLLKELESPYKISGFSANPYLYNITKVVVLSAFSAVLTEMLGFKLKLYKIKLIR